MNRILFTVLCLTIASAALARAYDSYGQEKPRGINANQGEFKYQAIVYYVDETGRFSTVSCGGAIINEWYVLTSASCVAQFAKSLNKLELYFGTTFIYEKQQKRNLAEIKIPEEFKITEKHHDIALIRTTEQIEFLANIQPIALAASADVYKGEFVSSGFGLRFHPQHIMETMHRADQLHYHKTSIIPLEKCEQIIKVGSDSICTENVEGFSFIYGDRGNPLVANNVLYGIASWCDGPVQYPNVYTSVFANKEWIEENAVYPK